jgi:hypothetical protein
MVQPYMGQLPGGMKRCTVCAEPINENAKRCFHCQSEQSWLRQKLGLSNTVLPLLVALVTVTAAALPVIKDTFFPARAVIVASTQQVQDNLILVTLRNAGRKTGFVTGIKIFLINSPLGGVTAYDLNPQSGPVATPIDPERMAVLLLTTQETRTPFRASRNAPPLCHLVYDVTDGSGTNSNSSAVDCDAVKGFLGLAWSD